QYQLYIQQMEPDGIGSLYLAFEQLKEKLHKQGYFEEKHKKKLPMFPKHIGIITSPTGAAVRDIITTLKRRYPIAEHTIIPVLVQGQHAAASIKSAIEIANDQAIFDVLIVGRGGGSIEELWSFNEEIVAEAIFHSTIPIVAAVGHETDITISDYVADLRAPTPTAAAEIVVPSQQELKEKLSSNNRSIIRSMRRAIEAKQQHLQRLRQSYAFRYPEQMLKQKEQELDKHDERLEKTKDQHIKRKNINKKCKTLKNMKKHLLKQHPQRKTKQSTKKLNQLIKQKNNYMSQIFNQKSRQLSTAIEKLTLLNPLEIMRRGFAIPYTDEGRIINSSKQVHIEDKITVQLSDGTVSCSVTNVKEEKNDSE